MPCFFRLFAQTVLRSAAAVKTECAQKSGFRSWQIYDEQAAIAYVIVIGRQWAQSTHSSVKEAALQIACRLNGGNLRDTGHSSEAGPMAALAESLPV